MTLDKYRITFLVLIFIGFLLASCTSTNRLTMSVTQPAPVYVPKEVQKIGVLNRSLASESTKNLDVIDKILSAEGENLDEDGANRSVTGLFDALSASNRFSTVNIIRADGIDNPGLGVFPAALTWVQVEQICNLNDLDALIVLSFYDTDTKINYNVVPIEVVKLGIKIPLIEHHAEMFTLIKTGWRIYYPASKSILDEYVINERVVSKGVGINPAKAAEAILGRKEAVMDVSTRIGSNYPTRIYPYRVRVSRDYFVKGTDNFEVGKRRAQAGNWDSAAELWKRETTNAKSKVAGRAYYNMAIINEINGNLDEAIDWASKSYSDYNTKEALPYLRILRNRKAKEEQLRRESK